VEEERIMARGWSSKGVASQQADSPHGAVGRLEGVVSTEERDRTARRKVLMLARARTAGDLAKIAAPAQRDMLERALADLDRAIDDLSARPS
jgi:hypothetical protein